MLDFDLAEMYGTQTKRLKEQVRRNMDRFPEDFMFEITRDEYNSLRSQIATLETGRGKYSKYLPYAFTVHGVVMLSNVLQSKKAIDTSILIVRAFNAMRDILLNPYTYVHEVKELQNEVRQMKQYLEAVFADYNDINEDTRMQLENICEVLADLQAKNNLLNKPRNPIGFKQ
jgi:phage regulator Rha-like protein